MEIKIGFIIIHGILFIFMLLLVLNGYLRGSKKAQIDAIFTIIIIGLILFIGFRFGLIEALISIPICIFLYGTLSKPLAKFLAFKMLGFRTSINDGFNKPHNYKKVTLDIMSGKPDKYDKFFIQILHNPSIQAVLQKFGKTEDDFKEEFHKLIASGLVYFDLACDIMSNPKSLSQLFRLKEEGLSDMEVADLFSSYTI